MKNIFAKIVNNKPNSHWLDKNFFFATTLVIIAVNIIIFFAVGTDRTSSVGGTTWRWQYALSFENIIRVVFINGFTHLSLQHTLLNMLCFLVVGLYLERRMGSIKFFSLVVAMAFFSGIAIGANAQSINFRGFSGINFALYSYIIVSYIFYWLGKKQNKLDTILGAVVIGLIYIATCFKGGTDSFAMTWYPWDLFNNMGHYSGALAGLVLALVINIVKWNTLRQSQWQATY